MRLCDLPADVLVIILVRVDPSDVLSIRATCRSLYDVTFERSLWLDALAHVCAIHGAYLPSFDNLRMSDKELEKAALRPSRFVQHALNNQGDLNTTNTRILSPDTLCKRSQTSLEAHMAHEFSDAQIVPGGRFMLTVYSGQRIDLWKLDDNLEDANIPLSAAVCSVTPMKSDPDEWNIGIEDVCIPMFKSKVRVVIFAMNMNEDESGSHFIVYEIDPSAVAPDFRVLGTLIVDTWDYFCSFDGERLAITDLGIQLTVWDVVLDSSITWLASRSATMLSLDVGILVVLDDLNFASIYNISMDMVQLGRNQHVYLRIPPAAGFVNNNAIVDFTENRCPPGAYKLSAFRPRSYYGQRMAFIEFHFACWVEDAARLRGSGHKADIHVLDLALFEGPPCTSENPLLRRRLTLEGWSAEIDNASGVSIDTTHAVLWSEVGMSTTTIFAGICEKLDTTGSEVVESQTRRGVRMGVFNTQLGVDRFYFCPVSTKLIALIEGSVHIMEYA